MGPKLKCPSDDIPTAQFDCGDHAFTDEFVGDEPACPVSESDVQPLAGMGRQQSSKVGEELSVLRRHSASDQVLAGSVVGKLSGSAKFFEDQQIFCRHLPESVVRRLQGCAERSELVDQPDG